MNKRHQFIERSIERTDDLLRNNPDVARWLGPRAIELADVANDLFVPNVRHGVIQFPKEYQETEKIPAIALRPQGNFLKQRIWRPEVASKMTPGQREAAAQGLGGYGYRDSVEQRIEAVNQMLIADTECIKRIGGKVITQGVLYRQATGVFEDSRIQAYQLWGRPLLALAYNPKLSAAYSTVITHEYVHLLQARKTLKVYFEDASSDARQRFLDQWEQEAYSDSARFSLALTEADQQENAAVHTTHLLKWSEFSKKLYPDQGQTLGPYDMPPDHPCLGL